MSKTTLLALLAVCLFVFVGTSPVRAVESAAATRTVNVTGDADVQVAPDEVVLMLGVETWDMNIQVAKNQNDERIKKVIALTKDFGIDPKYVQTDQISIEPRYDGNYAKTNFLGYFVRKTIVITLKDISKFESFYTAALSAGVTHVQGIDFRTTELRKYRDQARALAIQAAREKASALAGELGLKIGAAQSFHEDSSGWLSWYSNRWGGSMSQNVVQNMGGAAPNAEGTLAPGQITVNARVTVTFELQ